MKVYLASPRNQMQASVLSGMNVLVSYALYSGFMDSYMPTFRRILIDSGAYSELTGNAAVDVERYAEWAKCQKGVVAWAGLDDIRGDHRRSMQNYQHGGFPTMHDTDPPDLLPELVAMARERNHWIGVGLLPPREGKEAVVRRILDAIPPDLHVHGWALRRYAHLVRLDSLDSTNWLRDAMKLRTIGLLSHLTYAETLDIMVKRYQRGARITELPSEDLPLWTNP